MEVKIEISLNFLIIHIRENCNTVEKLEFVECPQITAKGIDHIINYCNNLNTFVLNSVDGIDIEFLQKFRYKSLNFLFPI